MLDKKKIDLKEIVDAFDMLSDDFTTLYDKINCQIVNIFNEHIAIAEEFSDDYDFGRMGDWEKDAIKEAVYVFEHEDDYIALPSQFDIDEYSIMDEFSDNYPNDTISSQLSQSLSGKGAFRRFKDMVNRLGIENEWYAYKDKALTEKASAWCIENQIEYTENQQRRTL